MEALSKALERRRAHYNALFAEARQKSTELEGADLLEQLRERVAPVLAALPAVSEEAEDRVLEALYRASLELLTRRLGGQRGQGTVNQVWELLLPRVSGLLAIAPRRLVAALTNAAFNLDRTPGARPQDWLRRMLAVSPHCGDLETLLGAGQIAAWRSGLPQFRPGALQLCRALPEVAVRALLEPKSGDGSLAVTLDLLAQRRFGFAVGAPLGLTLVGKLGGFTGYGGPFATPPKLTLIDGLLIAFDHETAWEIHADAFGSLLRRRQTLPTAAEKAPGGFDLARDGTVRCGQVAAHLPVLADASAWAADGEVLAAVPARSHHVFLVALTQGVPC